MNIRIKSLKKWTIYIIIGFSLFVAGFSTSFIQYKGMNFTAVVYGKIKEFLDSPPKYEFMAPTVIESSRYQINLNSQFPIKGEYQITIDSKNNLYAIDRKKGDLFFFKQGNLENGKLISNIYKDLYISLNNRRNYPPIAMDLHYVNGKLLYSIVLSDESNRCEYMILARSNVEGEVVTTTSIFFKTPCINDQYNSIMWGGRFTNSNKNIFLSIGEQRFDRSGFPKKDLKIIDPITTNIFGTVLKFSLNLDEWVVFATGLRNPQGLFWDEGSKRLFESEHGPNGGDEINILEEGLNYGWPYTSFGKPYAKKYPSGVDELDQARNPRIGVEIELKKLISQSDFHSGHTLPIFSWIPGVGAGNLLYMNKSTILKDWRDNLIVAHMGNGELHRLSLSKNKVLLDEKILLGFRVRDILINQNGILYFSSDDGTLMAYHTYDSKLD